VLLSIEEYGYAHLFAYSPSSGVLTRLTWGRWSDIAPALSPDAKSIAFASNRDGFWDLYRMDLQTAAVTRLTDSPEFDGSPTWSPDLAWLAYETYNNGHLDIGLLPLTGGSEKPVLLTDDAASDHSPAWAPNGRQIAFISDRTGASEVWIADLNKSQDRFTSITATRNAAESHPVWDADGTHLAWAASVSSPGYSGLYVWDATEPERPAKWVGDGNWPAWSADGSRLVTVLDAANAELIATYGASGVPETTPQVLPGHVRGIAWTGVAVPDPLPVEFAVAAAQTQPPPAPPPITPEADVPAKRWYLLPLGDVAIPDGQLHAAVAQAFTDLRDRVIADAGWDALASLQNAYVPLTTALDPGLQEDWLYTGRAFAINTLMVNAGWMAVAREDIGTQTFWRLYLRTQKQDGSQGAPIEDPPWNLNARYQLDPQAYEAGGDYAPVPPGYWIDLTSLAAAYGWERLPALSDWRSYYGGARFTEFAITGGLDWYSAMLELYPVDALITSTPVLPPTVTPSRTPIPTETPLPTWTPRPTRTPTSSATAAPPTATVSPSSTPVPSPTPPTLIPTFPSPTP
jgi:TolB protein